VRTLPITTILAHMYFNTFSVIRVFNIFYIIRDGEPA